MMRIHVAILAAGQSMRYGSEDKLSEQVGGKSLLTILREKIQRISAPWKGCTVLVVSRELAKLCTDGPEICVVNGDPKRDFPLDTVGTGRGSEQSPLDARGCSLFLCM